MSLEDAKRLAADPAVEKVVQNKKFTIDATQTNPPSWGLDRIDQTETMRRRRVHLPRRGR